MSDSLSEHAAGNLAYIRQTIGRTRTVSSLSGAGLIAMGLVGCVASALASGLWVTPSDPDSLIIWQLAAVAAVVVGGSSIAWRAHRTSEPFWTDAGRRFTTCLAPCLALGAALTVNMSGTESATLLPGIWLFSYGAGVLAAGTYASAPLQLLGLSLCLLGTMALTAPQTSAAALLCGFGLGHLFLGAVFLRRET
ncbi:MAG: hypothetical protein NXH85_07205 [Pseudomonadaceae bacterium]|nr:hypothetical protein [Pseudomonadaceae bacterium]